MSIRIVLLTTLTMAAVWASCGGQANPPQGNSHVVLVADIPVAPYQGAEMNIGFDSVSEWQKLKSFVPDPSVDNQVYVYGLVVPDPNQSLGYHLDPATTSLPAGFPPETQFSMRQITEKLTQWQGQQVYVVLHVRVEKYLN